MNAPTLQPDSFDYVDFDGASPEWWQAYRKRQRVPVIEPHLSDKGHAIVAATIPNRDLHKHIARVGSSREDGRVSFLTTTGHLIQEAKPQPAAESKPAGRGAKFISRDVDAAGVAVVMSMFERDGFKLSAEQIPFGKTWKAEDKNRIRKLWAEVENDRQASAKPTGRPGVDILRRPAAAPGRAYA